MPSRLRLTILAGMIASMALLAASPAGAHGVSNRDAAFVASIDGPAVGPFLYLGAKHMVTGYDHLLFLVGVIFFLYRAAGRRDLREPVHPGAQSSRCWPESWAAIHANPYLIDAIIGLSVVYKAFENMGGSSVFSDSDPTRAPPS
jgi:hypothetical protein